MTRHKYPAPFDPPEHVPLSQLYADPNVPLPTAPPLPVDIPVDKPPRPPSSLYSELFGDDLNVLSSALTEPWSSERQRDLSAQILSGRKVIHNLSTGDREVLDGLARDFNEGSSGHGAQEPEAARAQEPDSESFSGAYGWLGEG